MVCKLCEKSSSSTLQASITASKRMHAAQFFRREILLVAHAAAALQTREDWKKRGMQNEPVKLNKWN
jgi:hypothetical protein